MQGTSNVGAITVEAVTDTDVREVVDTTGIGTGSVQTGTGAADSNEEIDHTDEVRDGGTDRQTTGAVAVRAIGDPPHPCNPPKPGGGSLLWPEPPGAAGTRGAGTTPSTTEDTEDHGANDAGRYGNHGDVPLSPEGETEGTTPGTDGAKHTTT